MIWTWRSKKQRTEGIKRDAGALMRREPEGEQKVDQIYTSVISSTTWAMGTGTQVHTIAAMASKDKLR